MYVSTLRLRQQLDMILFFITGRSCSACELACRPSVHRRLPPYRYASDCCLRWVPQMCAEGKGRA